MGRADDIAELRALAERLDSERRSAPPGYRPAITLAQKYARDMADALEEDDAEGVALAQEEMQHGPKWLRPHLSEVLTFLRIEGDPPEEVWVRWDLVPEDLRDATVSLASLIVDALRGDWSPGGRPKNSRPKPGTHPV